MAQQKEPARPTPEQLGDEIFPQHGFDTWAGLENKSLAGTDSGPGAAARCTIRGFDDGGCLGYCVKLFFIEIRHGSRSCCFLIFFTLVRK